MIIELFTNLAVFLCDDAMFPTSELYEMFSESKCPKLSGRLKMFFIDVSESKVL